MSRKTESIRITGLLLALLSAACADVPGPAGPEPPMSAEPRADRTGGLAHRPVSLDERFAGVAEREPAFGGMYFDGQGRLNVVVTQPGRSEASLRSAITAVFDEPRFHTVEIVTRPGTYGFRRLEAWGRRLPRVAAAGGVLWTDIDEVGNRLGVGIENEAARPRVEAELTRLGIPHEVVTIRVVEPARLMATLQDRVSSAIQGGGLKISYTSTLWCTLGWTAWYNGAYRFVTNGHCSNSWGYVDPTPFYQPTFGNSSQYIGSETVESRLISSAEDPRCPTSAYACKWSDISMGTFAPGVSMQHGYIHRTTQRTRLGGSLTVSGRLTINDKTLGPLIGDVVDKIGARTGWTYGQVLQTPQFLNVSGYYFIIPNVVDAGVFGGDSGSAVFFWDGGSNARLAGQVFGGQAYNGSVYTQFIMSNINNIQAELGNVASTIHGYY